MVAGEELESDLSDPDNPQFFYRFDRDTQAWRSLRAPGGSDAGDERQERILTEQKTDVSSFAQSVLAGYGKLPIFMSANPELDYLAEQFRGIWVQQAWDFGRNTPPRMPQPTDLPGDFLLPNASNLSLVLNQLEHKDQPMRQITENLRKLYHTSDHITTRILGGTVQTFIHEKGLTQPIPATRLSDGTFHFLCLLTILCHPSPPPIICLEEPELGLHPDVLPTIAELLVEASKRTQIIVTTHSDMLVSALSDHPEAIMVCENDGSGTKIRRLEPDKLKEWLKDYSLGELWLKGEIGGTRW